MRDTIKQSRRDHAIRQRFYSLVREEMPAMRAYAAVGNEFYLSEERVRKIVLAQFHKEKAAN